MNKRQPAAVDRFLATDFIEHNPNLPQGRDGRKQFVAALRQVGIVLDEVGRPKRSTAAGWRLFMTSSMRLRTRASCWPRHPPPRRCGEGRQDSKVVPGGSHRKAHDDLLFGFIARY